MSALETVSAVQQSLGERSAEPVSLRRLSVELGKLGEKNFSEVTTTTTPSEALALLGSPLIGKSSLLRLSASAKKRGTFSVTTENSLIASKLLKRCGLNEETIGKLSEAPGDTYFIMNPSGGEQLQESVVALRRELSRLQQQIQALRQDVDQKQRTIKSLEAKLKSTQVESRAYARASSFRVSDPYGQWIRDHMDELKKFPDQYVAIDLEGGIILAEKDGKEFSRKLQEEIKRRGVAGDKYLRMHTSTYLDEE